LKENYKSPKPFLRVSLRKREDGDEKLQARPKRLGGPRHEGVWSPWKKRRMYNEKSYLTGER